MNSLRQLVLRANALYLGIAATGGLITDVRGIFLEHGPVGRVVAAAPHAGIGFVEAHGLALIIGVLLWRAVPSRAWHLTAAAVHLLLGTANLMFWQIFSAADTLATGYITTLLHWLFVVLQLYAAATLREVGTATSSRVA